MGTGIIQKVGLTKVLLGGVILAAIASVIVFKPFKGNARSGQADLIDPAFGKYIGAYTTGIVSSRSNITVSFVESQFDSFQYEQEVKDDLFDFSPSIDGKAYWISNRTIEFRPESPLPYGTAYQSTFHLEKLVEVKRKLEDFAFSFQTMELNAEMEVYGLSFDEIDGKRMPTITGNIICSDVVDSALVKEMFGASQNGNDLSTHWTHYEGGRSHRFQINGVERFKSKSSVKIEYRLDHNGGKLDGTEEVEVPAVGDFLFLSGRVFHAPEQYVSLRFSDPLDESQNLQGLITMTNLDFNYDIEGNEIKIYPVTRQIGKKDIFIQPSIRNAEGNSLSERHTFEAVFEQMKPSVRWVDDGNIVPTDNGVYIPFEAVALEAVDVEVVKVYESNAVQFFQVNQINGNDELARVGRSIHRKTISLKEAGIANLSKWNRFNIDLSSIVQKDPGAIYQVNISYRMQHAIYECAENDTLDEQEWDEKEWDVYHNYYYYYNRYGPGYSYYERDNPCHVTYYYNHGSGIRKNILASNIGIIAKRGKFNNVNFAVTNLKTAAPIPDAQVDVYSLQQQVLQSVTTNSDGMAEAVLENKPFMAVVKADGMTGYLRLDHESNLSLSHFNTAGTATSTNGLKGYIYGERGVWRPGDSIYLTLMLEDKEKVLPEGHPIVFELESPRGRIVKRMMLPTNPAHTYAFKTKTDVSSPTGLYTARMMVGDNYFTKSIPIETIKPNRLKIKLDMESENLTASDPYLKGQLDVKWLHGAVAKNMDAKIEAMMYSVSTTFDKYTQYDFDDDARSFDSEMKEVYSGTLDDKGQSPINANLQPEFDAPGKLMARLKTTVTEKSGNSSIDIFNVPYYPYDNYVGINVPEGNRGWLQTDTTHEVGIVLVDADGKQIRDSRTLEVELWKIDWRWWWDRSSDRSLSNYVYSRYRTPILKESTTVSAGKGTFDLKINRPNWGRFYLKVHDPVSGHSTGAIIYVSWPYWAGKPNDQSGVSVLEFSADKESYEVGDQAKVNIPTTPNGRALVSLENGSKVVRQFWVNTQEGSTDFTFDVEPEMAPNVYVHVSLLQPYANTDNDLPIRLYGITNVNVVDPETQLHPEINMPEVLRPEEEFTLEVSEEEGREMVYTIAVVDEGLLDLTRFKTPQPWDHFYAKEALGVSSYDMYKYVVGAKNGELSNVLGIGGDLDGKAGEESKLNRFEPVTRYLGPFKLAKGKTAKHNIKLPYYVGSVRTMVVARQDEAYGNAEKATPVRKPLMVLATLPRVLSPNEEVLLPVSAFAMEDHVKSAEISVEVNDIVSVSGPSKQTIKFKELGEEMAYFRLSVKNKIGIAHVTINAKSGKETSKDEIKLEVRAPNPPVTKIYDAILEKNGDLEIAFETMGIEGTNSGVIEVSSIPPLQLEKNLQYLIRYPHGCVEQTTSSVFPQLYLSDLMDLTPTQEKAIEQNINAGINRLLNMQTSDGGLGYWPGAETSSEWGSNYGGHFLVEAYKKGYNVPSSALNKWASFQKRISDSYTVPTTYYRHYYYRYTIGLNQAYRLYTLASVGKANLGAMNRLKGSNDLCLAAYWRLASAYAMAGQEQVAKDMVTGREMIPESYTQLSYTYGSDLRDKAMILETLIELGEKTKAAQMLKVISEQMNQNRWYSTQTRAYCLMAASKYAGVNNSNEPIHYTYQFGSGNSTEASTGMSISKVTMTDADLLTGKVKLENKQNALYYVQVSTIGQPAQGDSTDEDHDLIMTVDYKDLDGNEIDISTLEQGTQFMATVSVRNPGLRGYYEEMALTQMFPSGWEIVNTRFEGTDDIYLADKPEYRDIRDDRVLTYFDIRERQTLRFNVLLTASYAGKYYLPTVSCDAMYDNSIYSHTAGKWVNVVTNYVN